MKSQFVSMVSHELRTPLTSIRASMQLLVAEGKADDPDADQLLRVALSNANRLIRIVNDILDKQKSGRPVLVGTVSIEKSERLSKLLKVRGIKHVVLNAK